MKNGLYCSAGFNWFSIGSEGRVSVCNALIYRTDNKIYLGNILKDDIILRKDEFGFRCPNQECQQICDRHWSRKKIYKDDVEIDSQNLVNPNVYSSIINPISILFSPTWKCNFSCKYCTLPSKNTYPTLTNVCDEHSPEKWIDGFSNFFDKNQIGGGIWHTNGGEPLYYKGIDKLFSFFESRKFKIALTSNMTGDIYKIIVNSTDPSCFEMINCSLHPLDKNFKWEQFKNSVQLLKMTGYPVSVNFVGHPDQLTLALEYSEWCKDIGVNFSLIPFLGNVDGISFLTIKDYPEPLKNIIYKLSSINLQDNNKFIEGKRVIGNI